MSSVDVQRKIETHSDWSYFRLFVISPLLGSGYVFESLQTAAFSSQAAVGLAMTSLPRGDKAVCTMSMTRGSHKTLGRLLTVEKLKLLEHSRVSLLSNTLILSH